MSATWITITTANLQDSRAATMIAAVQTTALASGQSDPVPNIIASVCGEVRGAIGFSGKYQVSATASTVPPNLKDMTVQKIIRMAIRRLNQGALLTEDDRQEERVYESRLNLIREGRYPVDLPDDPMPVAPSTPLGRVEYIPGDRRLFTTKGLRNL